MSASSLDRLRSIALWRDPDGIIAAFETQQSDFNRFDDSFVTMDSPALRRQAPL